MTYGTYIQAASIMSPNLSLFPSLDNLVQIDVTLGNNVQVTVLGKGTVGILTKQGEKNFMPDFYHVEGLNTIY